jgi:hypothetical protein
MFIQVPLSLIMQNMELLQHLTSFLEFYQDTTEFSRLFYRCNCKQKGFGTDRGISNLGSSGK